HVCTPMAIFRIRWRHATNSNRRVYPRSILESAPFSRSTVQFMACRDTSANIREGWLFVKDNWKPSFHWKTPQCPDAPLSSGTKTIAKIWELLRWICLDLG